MKNYIEYKGGLIARNSEAFKLWEAKNFTALDKHLKQLNQAAKQRGEIL